MLLIRPDEVLIPVRAEPDVTTGETTSHLTRLSNNDNQVIGYSHSTRPAVRGCCRFSGFTTTAYPLRVRGQVAGYVEARSSFDKLRTNGLQTSLGRINKHSNSKLLIAESR